MRKRARGSALLPAQVDPAIFELWVAEQLSAAGAEHELLNPAVSVEAVSSVDLPADHGFATECRRRRALAHRLELRAFWILKAQLYGRQRTVDTGGHGIRSRGGRGAGLSPAGGEKGCERDEDCSYHGRSVQGR